MADNTKFNKIVKKLDGRHFGAKSFYDFYGNKIDIGYNEVYLKKEVDALIKMLKELQDMQVKEIKTLKQQREDLELENYSILKKVNKIKIEEPREFTKIKESLNKLRRMR